MANVVRFDAEPFGIPYWFGGETKKYFPDVMVQFADGHVEVWEIKPASQTAYEVNDAKWTAADKFCEARGWHFE
ncbi:TnsA endonuclease N-terminal domain-containing protein, partial [Acinetobacter baumannii]